MNSLEADLEQARALEVAKLADAIESIGFECTRCGACCTSHDGEAHTATVFPDEIRRLQAASADAGDRVDSDADEAPERDHERDWRDVARPMPYGLHEGADGLEGETFEWALQTDGCGDCVFYTEDDDGLGACSVHGDRPLICQTYPFSVALAGTSQPMGEAVDEAGIVRAHECEGLGRDISRADAEALARTLKTRAVRELEEAIAVRDAYEPPVSSPGPGEVVVHDSEGAKRIDGTPRDDEPGEE
ncbi:YkgJ family cysteine cluster protein [Natrarchaeobaculum aegyptiacum]|uniref:Zinc/iron-chelating domain-containing protein n=1 Tax=Natrarchaeobaculum aegyptiacum TaxID=745377 RepID=A0A2Z2HTD2_9EURY|nr:YkgJ family cysteine cluster protein [Natrarchaeobaculum aegyptiacum]ARS89385.1 zinc/iron-chelating domain-containing protein [Natrarchaeobaculum aegyptiacum]